MIAAGSEELGQRHEGIKVVEEEQAPILVNRAEALEIVEAAYRAAADGLADVSKPSALALRGQAGSGTTFKVKGAVLDTFGVAGFRLIADVGDTSQEGFAYLYVLDANSGRPIGLVSELWLHRLRTASTGLVTCRALLPEGARTLALIGTGRIAEEFVRSCHLALPELELLLCSRSDDRSRRTAERWRSLTPFSLTSAPITDAVSRADVVVTLSDAAESLFSASQLKPRALVCGMGGRHEFDSDVLTAAETFVVDEIDFVCTAGSGAHWIKSGQIDRGALASRVHSTIGELLLGLKEVPQSGRVLAIIQGMAICDLALAKAALDRSL